MHTATPQRMAWITMLGALGVFILLCASTVAFARWLLFESPTQLDVMLHVGRGTVGVAEPDSTGEQAERGVAAIDANSTLSTDNDSQGYLEFSDPYSGDVLATVLLRGNSTARLREASRPRFNLSDNPTVIRVSEASGQLEVWVSDETDREVRLEIRAPLGTTRIDQAGRILITSTPENLVVTTLAGSATLVSASGQAQYIGESTEATVRPDDPVIQVGPGPVDLIANSRFEEGSDWPVGWRCTNDLSGMNPDAPLGSYNFVNEGGRAAIHITRTQPNPGHGETGCLQVLLDPEQGLDVRQYNDLRLRVTMKIHQQSLSACGILGTECPVMLYILYRDVDGNGFNWYHGFYVELRPAEEARKICPECLEEHEYIKKEAWYTYESGNLFTDLPQDRRPGYIVQIEFYASGHQYDVMLDEVALLARPGVSPDEQASAP